MTMIRQYINAMSNRDFDALGKLFAPDGVYCDFCPEDVGQPKYYAYGPEGIDMFFRNRFIFRCFEITDPVIISDTQAYYFAVYGNFHLQALATIQSFDGDGNIQRLVVRPA